MGSVAWWSAIPLTGILTIASITDIRNRIIPNWLILFGVLTALTTIFLFARPNFTEHFISGLVGGGVFFLLSVAFPRGMGMGDTKLIAIIGFFVGYGIILTLFISLFVGVIYGVSIAAKEGFNQTRKATIPFAPCLLIGWVGTFILGLSV